MSDNKKQLDGEFGLDYQLFILRKMIGELPNETNQLLHEQLNEVIKSMATRNKLIKIAILRELEDVRLDVLAMDFDNSATKRERDELQRKLNELL